ncbi:MAG TPA: DPP IV N-terminal domain-containing protein, partial [Bacteroidales bacterium]|nr:DPP IV N-terminal domain-containing protein [Bacteroidales bacterium]
MKITSVKSIRFLFILIALAFAFAFNSHAQRPMQPGATPRVVGWADNTHFLYQTLDEDRRPITMSVDIRTGRGVVAPSAKSDREILEESLPSGVTIGFNDVVSPDNNSVIFVKDNDLFYFRKGDRDLRQVTQDDQPEVNARFSPDGRKIAYTKNRDLYVFDLEAWKEIRLSFDATDRIYNGYASWVYMEEILGRQSRYAAFWWAPDGSK